MSEPVIAVTGLSKYYGKARGIEHVDFQVREGEIFGFIGPNGAGKSTTIRILLNLIFPDKGIASIFGLDVTRDISRIMRHVGYVPSDANAYGNMDVLAFLKYCHRFYGPEHADGRIEELASWFELDLKRKISDLSLGNRKKVSIVQSLMHKPRLLILDEPTTGLDPLMQAKFFELLRLENQQGMTVFFSSHILNEVQQLCKRVAIIKEGCIIQTEEIQALRKKQLKRVTIEPGDSFDTKDFKIPSAQTELKYSGNSISFMYPGDLNDLVDMLAGKKLKNLTIEEPSLEEIFIHFYH